MSKLTFVEKELAAEFKIEVAELGGEIFYNPINGMSAVVLPNDRVGGFARVYLAYCSKNEKFGKKRARLVLQDRVYNDNYVLVPIKGETYADIVENVFFPLQ